MFTPPEWRIGSTINYMYTPMQMKYATGVAHQRYDELYVHADADEICHWSGASAVR